ncbi:MAG: cytochrome c oxidase assembly protein [Caulobacteraceae bacterium]
MRASASWLAGLATAALTPGAALARGTARAPDPIWLKWDFSPWLVIPTVIALILWWRGIEKRPTALDAAPVRSLAFPAGVFLTFVSLASPIDGMADHLFWMHQVQHMLLRMMGPMLIAFGQPQATLVAGSPNWLRRGPIAFVLTSGPCRRLFAFLTDPWVATTLFVASLYVWQWPPFHDTAILHDGVHDSMHFTMLAAGLLFFWRVFDQRPPPKGARFGVRLIMLWIGTLANVPIGAFICFKSVELYPAYDVVGRLFGVTPMADERLGGFIMWAPASMMMLIPLLVVIHAWAGQEERTLVRRGGAAAGESAPVTPRSGVTVEEVGKNRAFALALAAFPGFILAATVVIAIFVIHEHRVRAEPAWRPAASPSAPPMETSGRTQPVILSAQQ